MISKKMIVNFAYVCGIIYLIYMGIKSIELLDSAKTKDQITIGALILTVLIVMYGTMKHLFEKSDKKDH